MATCAAPRSQGLAPSMYTDDLCKTRNDVRIVGPLPLLRPRI